MEKRIPEAIDDKIVTVNIYELLNGVDLKARGERKRFRASRKGYRCYSYSHKDEWWRDRWKRISSLCTVRVIELWHDPKIEAGAEWKHEIDENLERADVTCC